VLEHQYANDHADGNLRSHNDSVSHQHSNPHPDADRHPLSHDDGGNFAHALADGDDYADAHAHAAATAHPNTNSNWRAGSYGDNVSQ
jgi:hypothetical protein